jgi:hypothetical protein
MKVAEITSLKPESWEYRIRHLLRAGHQAGGTIARAESGHRIGDGYE